MLATRENNPHGVEYSGTYQALSICVTTHVLDMYLFLIKIHQDGDQQFPPVWQNGKSQRCLFFIVQTVGVTKMVKGASGNLRSLTVGSESSTVRVDPVLSQEPETPGPLLHSEGRQPEAHSSG